MPKRFATLILVTIAVTAMAGARTCHGHGNPIVVHMAGRQLTVSGGLADDRGHAGMAFADPDESAVFEPGGSLLFTTLPGLEIFDVAPGERLWLQALSRPDFAAKGAPVRWLWYWDSTSRLVEDVPGDLPFEVASNDTDLSGDGIAFSQTVAPAGNLLVADLDADELGQHAHLLTYLLDNDPAAELGAYGFFARLMLPNSTPSQPFLVALNHGLGVEEFQRGARLINAAARLPGDYDGDDDVDGHDMLVWQRSLGSKTLLAADGSRDDVVNAADLDVWRTNVGRRVAAPSVNPGIQTPEPHALALAYWTAIALRLAAGGSRRSRRETPIAISVLGCGRPAPRG